MAISNRAGMLRVLLGLDAVMLIYFGSRAMTTDEGGTEWMYAGIAAIALLLAVTAGVQLRSERHRRRPGGLHSG